MVLQRAEYQKNVEGFHFNKMRKTAKTGNDITEK